MAVLARHILITYPQYRYLFSVSSFMFEGRPIPNIDGMLKLYPGAIGMKTGYTDLARFNLVTAAVRDGHMLIGVELHARGWSVAYRTMATLLDQGFAAEGAGTGPMIALRKALPSILPVADAATIHPPVARRVLVTVAAAGSPRIWFPAGPRRSAPTTPMPRRSIRLCSSMPSGGSVPRGSVPCWSAIAGCGARSLPGSIKPPPTRPARCCSTIINPAS
jgi:D-alanyl-D-alanine carboxypeptidase